MRLAGSIAAAALIVSLPSSAAAQAGRAEVREGNRLYEEGRYQEAHERYLQALAEAPESPVILFNDGNALYQSEDYQRAMEAYQQAIESGDPELASDAWYNLGNALYRQQQLQPSLEAYKQALRLSPNDVDAKHNFERVLQEIRQQEQQQNQDPQQDPGGQGEQDQQGSQGQQGQQDPEQDQQEGDQQDQQDQDGEQDPQDNQDQSPQDPQDGEGRSQPERQPGQMTPEEAERLLEAIQEHPDSVERRRAPATGPRPRRPW